MIFSTLVVQGYGFVTSSTLTNVIDNSSSNWDILVLHIFRTLTQPTFTCSKLTIELLEHGVKYVES